MNIILLDGSPKVKDSASEFILKSLETKINLSDDDKIIIKWYNARNYNIDNLIDDINNSDCLVIAFPLYVDGIPSHLLRLFETIELLITNKNNKLKIYTIINSGFYESSQNHLAYEMTKIWSIKCGFDFAQSLCIGAGPMIKSFSMGNGPTKDIGKNLDIFTSNILSKKTEATIFTKPNFPRFLYKSMANMGWNIEAKNNGIKLKELYQKQTKIEKFNDLVL